MGAPRMRSILACLPRTKWRGNGRMEDRIRELLKIGFNRVLFLAPVAAPDKQWPVLERYAALIRNFV